MATKKKPKAKKTWKDYITVENGIAFLTAVSPIIVALIYRDWDGRPPEDE